MDKGKTATAASGGETMTARCDLHVHSKHSNRPPEWILRQLGSPESFMEPLEVYRRCKRRGMRFVTLSDHDAIGGALEIAHLPDTFVSCEVTAEFPEDGCQIHCLVWGIDEARHRTIQEPGAFAAAMARLHDEPALGATLGRRAAAAGEADSWSAVADALWGQSGRGEPAAVPAALAAAV